MNFSQSSALTAPGYVVVEEPIGVGKTTLARRLAKSFGCANDCWENFRTIRFCNGFIIRHVSLPCRLYLGIQIPIQDIGKIIGAEGRTRTDTVLPPPDFESGASTSFATPALEKRLRKRG